MKNYLIAISMFVVSIANGFSQEYKFGKVSKEELMEQVYAQDSSANATVLYENRSISVEYQASEGFQLVTHVHKRIKLYNKEGFDYATEEVFLYKNGSDKEVLGGLKAVTYNLNDGKIEEIKLKKEGVFKSEYSENYNQYKFTMPSIKEGSVIEFKYKITSPFLSNVDRIYLQYEIPIKKIDVKVKSPEYFNYKKFSTGYLPISLKEDVLNDKITFTNKTRTGGYALKTNYSRNDVSFKVSVNTIQSTNVPAFKKEPFAGNIENYISSLSYELSYVKFPNEPIDYRATTWEDVTKTIYKSSNFGGELKKTDYFEEDIDQLIKDGGSQIEKVSKIFSFVNRKMNWNDKYGVVTNKGVKKAYKDGTGNVAEINLMLTSMLTYAKIDANPVVVSSSDRLISLFPTLNGFNYVITRVKLADGSVFYLDATDKYGLPNILPSRVIRGMGRVIAKNGTSQMVSLRPYKPSANRYNIQYEINEDGSVKGKFNVRHLKYLAHSFRVRKGALDDESKVEKLKESYNLPEIEEYSVKGVKEYGKGVNERFNFVCEDQIEIIDNEMFFSPLLFLKNKENIFKSDERNYPVDFGYGYSNMYMINIKIPEGYEIVEYPKSGGFRLPDDLGAFSYRSNVSNGIIQITVNETISNPMIPSDYYGALKEFYNQIIQKEEEQVVLKKV